MNDNVVRVANDQGVHSEVEEEQQSRGIKRSATWQEEVEYQERMEKLESERAKRRREEARFFLETIKELKGDGSERDQIQQMDFQRTLMDPLHRATIREIDGDTTQQGAQPAAILDAQPKHHEITISEVATRILGRLPNTGELQKFGKRTVQLYRQKVQIRPHKRIKFVDGAPRQVNPYSTKDLELIEKAIHEVMN